MQRDPDLTLALETARLAVDAAADACLRHFRGPLEIETKADRSPVTAADRESEQAIVAIIQEVYASHTILAEERGLVGPGTGDRWIVDPLDGTRGFSRGGNFWGPLVAFESGGEIVAGAMALPALRETYWAARGMGCYRNGERLRVSAVGRWEDATLQLGEMRGLLYGSWADGAEALIRSAASVRCFGDLAGCAQILAGRADAWIESGVKVWDLAPLMILVEEAGGRFTDLEGRETVESGHALATNGLLHDHALVALGAAARGR